MTLKYQSGNNRFIRSIHLDLRQCRSEKNRPLVLLQYWVFIFTDVISHWVIFEALFLKQTNKNSLSRPSKKECV